jgi:hypothetical protein
MGWRKKLTSVNFRLISWQKLPWLGGGSIE